MFVLSNFAPLALGSGVVMLCDWKATSAKVQHCAVYGKFTSEDPSVTPLLVIRAGLERREEPGDGLCFEI